MLISNNNIQSLIHNNLDIIVLIAKTLITHASKYFKD